MDLFTLLGTIIIDNELARRALNEVSEQGNQTEGKLSGAFKKIGSAAAKVGKAVAAGMAAAGTAVAGLVTKSIQSYADFEQLVGGADTLFKESSQKIQDYADAAYKTAGLSANEYMETVTSFSASLLQSLGGDTDAAAEKANMAIIDMSDNANKMGTSMEMIQNAYNGFAKQNYTMLDNLKLGYGGTKEEMQRLLEDAQAISGIEYDISSYGDVVDAIHVIQNEMGITGTTAREASSTISGSIGMMKSSWANLLTALSGDGWDIGVYVANFVDSVSTVADNLLPRIEIALNGVVELINRLAPTIIGRVPELLLQLLPAVVTAATSIINALVEILPGVVSAITGMLPAIIQGFEAIINGLVSALPAVVQVLLDALPQMIPLLVNALESMFVTLCTVLPQIIQPIIEALPGLAEQIVNCILDMLPGLLDGIMTLITALVEMLPQVVPQLLSGIISIVQMIVDYLPDTVTMLVDAVIQILTMVIDHIPQLIPTIIEAVIEVINRVVAMLPTIIPLLIDAVVQIITMVAEMLPELIPMLLECTMLLVQAVIDNLPTILEAVVSAVVDLIPTIIPVLLDCVLQIVQAIINYLPTFLFSIISAVTDALPALLESVWDVIVMVFEVLPEWFGQLFEMAVTLIKEAWQFAGEFFSGIWQAIKDVFAVIGGFFLERFREAWAGVEEFVSGGVDAVVGFFTDMKEKAAEKFASMKESASENFDKMKSKISSSVESAKTKVSSVFGTIKSNISSHLTGAYSTVSSKFESIKTKISDTITSAKETVSSMVEKIKGAFNFSWSLPKLKLPHISVSGGEPPYGIAGKGSLPKFSIEWYKSAMNAPKIMNEPTIFGYNSETGKFMGGGEAGSEVVAGTNTLMNMINAVVAENNEAVVYYLQRIVQILAGYFPQFLEAMDQEICMDGVVVARKISPHVDRELARIQKTKERGGTK